MENNWRKIMLSRLFIEVEKGIDSVLGSGSDGFTECFVIKVDK
jgi:hypothetical protein